MKYIHKDSPESRGRIVRTRANTPTFGISDIHIGVGWNKVIDEGAPPLDLDLHLALCGTSGRATDLVYHQHQVSRCGAAWLSGDNIDGEGPGWDEAIGTCWKGLDSTVTSIEAFLVINQAEQRNQHFGMVTGYISATNSKGEEVISRSLAGHSGATSLIIAEARRVDGWDLRFPFEETSFGEIIDSLGIAA